VGCVSYRDLLKLRPGIKVKVGGLVADGLRRPPTANGTSFLRLEQSDGILDVVVSPQVYTACREALHAAFLVVEGKLQRNGPNLTVVAQRVKQLD
jgi:DNA polymerase III alpha subunit